MAPTDPSEHMNEARCARIRLSCIYSPGIILANQLRLFCKQIFDYFAAVQTGVLLDSAGALNMFTRAERRHPPQREYDRIGLSQHCSCNDRHTPEGRIFMCLHFACSYGMGLPLMKGEEHATTARWVAEMSPVEQHNYL